MTDTPECPELLPCPFCGGNAAMSFVAGAGCRVECSADDCELMPDTGYNRVSADLSEIVGRTRDDAISAWNRRASSLGEPVSQEAPWVVWSHERSAWWRANRQGYAGSLFGAGVYSEDEAKAIEDDSHRGR